ncbi:MFS transporter [Chloroflexota bacterium]
MTRKNVHYGWVIAIAGAGIQSAHALSVYTFGVFLRPLTMEFGWERGALSVAASLAGVEMGFLAIITGKLSDKYGPRVLVTFGGVMLGTAFLLMTQINSLWQVYLFWGLCIGIAASCSIVPILSTIPRWFIRKRGVAISIIATGFGLGAMISPLLAQLLISSYGWKQSFMILGIVAWIIIIPLAQLMRQNPRQMGLRPYGEGEDTIDKETEDSAEGLTFAEALKTAHFWIFGAIQFFWFFCLQTIVVHITPHAIDLGIPEIAAASILSVIAGSSVIARFSMGFISDKLGSRLALSLCLILSTLALLWLLFASEIWAFYLFAITFGLAYGGFIPLLTVLPSELFGVRSLGVILGAFMLYSHIGSAGGAPLAGFIFDTSGNYRLALIICVIFCTITAILGVILLRYKQQNIDTSAP